MESIETVVKEIIALDERAKKIEEDMMNEGGQEKADLIDEFRAQTVGAQAAHDAFASPYRDRIETLAGQIQDKKAIIETEMLKAKEKTVELDFATVKMTTTKSVKIFNKLGLVNALTKVNDGIEKGIKGFNLSHIRKLMEVNVVTPDLAEFEETRRVKITAKGPNLAELAAAEKALTEEQDKEDADVKGYEEAEATE